MDNMDNLLAGGVGQAVGQFPLEQWFYEMPVCTRWWTTATVLTSILVQCHMVTPFQLFYSYRAVFVKSQVGAIFVWPIDAPDHSTDTDLLNSTGAS